MSLPKYFANADQYFEEFLKFFDEYQVLYKFPNTEVLAKNVLDHLKIGNLENIDIYKENFDLEAINDVYLNTFFEKFNRLRGYHDGFVEDKVLENIFEAPLGSKKKHEIVYLAREIKESCESISCKTVVDFGSGLGYLDQLVFKTTNFKVLGLECNEGNYVCAKKRQRKYHANSTRNVKYIRHTITADSSTNIKLFLEDKFADQGGFCITGLHSCADLPIDAIDIFLKMPDAKSLVMVPCCYHRMAPKGRRFKNFPLSSSMREAFEKYKGFEYLKVPFLRLGAQPPNGCNKFKDSVFNLLARAVLEQYAQNNNCKLKRNKRKAVKTKKMDRNFEQYSRDASSHGFTLINKSSPSSDCNEVEFNLKELRQLWRQIDDVTAKKAGIFILLQYYLQPVIENCILFDRLIYLRENGIERCRYKKVFDESISPRCLVLLANK